MFEKFGNQFGIIQPISFNNSAKSINGSIGGWLRRKWAITVLGFYDY